MKLTAAQIARITHAANFELRQCLGEEPVDWGGIGEERRQGVTKAVQNLRNGYTSPQESHSNWVISMAEQGWSYGTYDPEAKTHPNMVPWDQLPPEQQAKDRLFLGIVHALRQISE